VNGPLVAIAGGGFHSLALKGDRTVFGWGNNTDGEANGAAAGSNVVAIAAGEYHSLALKADGTVVGWGDNYIGQANGAAAGGNVVAIAAGGFHSLALKADGTVVGWGRNNSGQANGAMAGSNVVAIAAGYDYSLALKADGTVVAWGVLNAGLTDWTAVGDNVMAIAAGAWHSLALKADGTVVGWGDNLDGQAAAPAAVTNFSLSVVRNGTVDTNSPGQYTLTYSATNALGWTASGSRTVVVTDTRPPALTLLGANPLMVEVGSPLVDPGATATDLCAGDLTANIVSNLVADSSAPGTYTNRFTVSDVWGNTAQTNRLVVVVTQPVLGGFVQPEDGSFRLSFMNTPGACFNVLTTTNPSLPLSQWIRLGPASESPPGQFQFTDLAATNQPLRFYRLQWP